MHSNVPGAPLDQKRRRMAGVGAGSSLSTCWDLWESCDPGAGTAVPAPEGFMTLLLF